MARPPRRGPRITRPRIKWNLDTLLKLGLLLKANTPLFPHTHVYGLTAKGFKGRTITLEPGRHPRRYMQRISPADPQYKGPISKAPQIKVHCTCPDFQYRHQWVAFRRGFGLFPPEVDAPPDQTNPTRSPGICRHLTIVLAEIKKRGL